MNKSINLKWAGKVARAKHFVVLTDRESVIAMDGVDPNNIHDLMEVQAQSSSITAFREDLEELEHRHQSRIAALGGKVGITRSKREKATPKTTAGKTKVKKTK